jgi:UDP-4-amino-4,6-dideoxy-N-acetyl-beta-L-altrosamine transaminase
MIPYGHQDIRQNDIDAVVEVLRSEFITQGPAVPRFERAMAGHCGAKHAIALSSGTSALHVACLALGLSPGKLLWTVPNTFVASANCARYCGADVDFVDIDPVTWNMSVTALREKLLHARGRGRLPHVVVPVHFAGQPTDQEAIWDLAAEFGFKVLEDAAHSLGASRSNEPVGSCRWSHVTILSFHPVKIITTAEGGMALTNDPELASRMLVARTHGITRDRALMTCEPEGPWVYEQIELGYNYRMTDIQAALGLTQLSRVGEYVRARNLLANRYASSLARLPLRLPHVEPQNVSAFHLYVVRLRGDCVRLSHTEMLERLIERGIGANLHYAPVHLQPYYRRLGFGPGLCPEAEQHGTDAISLPLYPTLSEAQQDQVIHAVHALLS